MKTILKYTLRATEHQELELPAGSQALSCQEQHGELRLWVLVKDDRPLRKYSVYLYATGCPMEMDSSQVYLDTVQICNGLGVFHCFVGSDFI